MRLVKFIYFCFFWFNNFLDWPMWFIRSAFLHCVVFSNASSNGLPWCMYIDTGCIVLPPLHGVFSNVPRNCLLENIDIHTGCICLIFLQCASSNVSSYWLPERMQSHTGCFCLTLLHCAFSNVPSSCLPQRMYFTLHLFDIYLLCIIKRLLKLLAQKRIQSYTGYICLTHLCCVYLNVPSNGLLQKT